MPAVPEARGDDTLNPPPPKPQNTPDPEPGRILPLWTTSDGWSILQIGHWHIPGYDFEDACRGQSEDDIERELNLSWLHRQGKQVYREFKRARHVALDRIPYDPNRPLHLGWDWATQPTCVITQLNAYKQWCVLSALQVPVDVSVGLYDFVTDVAHHLYDNYAKPYGRALSELPMVHIGDPAGAARIPQIGEATPKVGSPRDVRSAFEILRDGVELFMGYDNHGDPVIERRAGFGWVVIPGEVALPHRLEGVRARLKMSVEGDAPAFVVDPTCHLVIDSLDGGYHYHERSDGRFEYDPFKDRHCVPDTYDALTPSGWKRHDELNVGDPIYVYDMGKDRLRVGVVQAVHLYEGEIDCLRFRNHSFEMTATPKHRCVARRRSVTRGVYDRYDPLEFVTADALHTGHCILTNTSLDGPGKPKAHFSDDLVRLCAWVMAEGSYRKTQGAILLSQSIAHNPEYVEQLDALLSRFHGVTRHSDDKDGKLAVWRIGRETAMLLRQLMPDKIISLETIDRMSTQQMRLFLYEYIRADGMWRRGKYGPLPEKTEIRRERDFWVRGDCPEIGQKSYLAVERLQIMATLCGMVSRIYRSPCGPRSRWGLTLSRRPKHGLCVDRLQVEAVTVPRVWCPTTDAGTWITRANGRPFITGNSDVADALGYITTRLFLKPEEADEGLADANGYRSQASRRR